DEREMSEGEDDQQGGDEVLVSFSSHASASPIDLAATKELLRGDTCRDDFDHPSPPPPPSAALVARDQSAVWVRVRVSFKGRVVRRGEGVLGPGTKNIFAGE